MDSRPAEYVQNPGLSSGTLRAFAKHGRNIPPRVAPSYDKMTGHGYEALIQGTFENNFFVLENNGTKLPEGLDIDMFFLPPEKIDFDRLEKKRPKWKKATKKEIESGTVLEISGQYMSINKSNIAYQNVLRQWRECPGKFPIFQDDFKQMVFSVKSLRKIELVDFGGLTVGEILDNFNPTFEVPIYWEGFHGEKIPKKALIDMSVRMQIGDRIITILFDFKYFKTLAAFERYLKYDHGWIQAVHYLAGAAAQGLEVHPTFIFLAGSKTEGELAQDMIIKPDYVPALENEYDEYCQKWHEWSKAGFPELGYRKRREVKIYAKNM